MTPGETDPLNLDTLKRVFQKVVRSRLMSLLVKPLAHATEIYAVAWFLKAKSTQ